MLSNASDPTGGKRASGLARSLSVRSGSLLCARRTQVGKKIQTRQGRSSVEVGGCGLYRAFWAWWRARARTYIRSCGVWEWSTRAGRQLDLHLVLAQSVRSKGAAGAVKGWPLVDALRQPTQTSRRTGEDALPHLCMWVRRCCGYTVRWISGKCARPSPGSIRPHRAYEAHCRVGHLARRGRHLLWHPHVTRMAAREEEEL